LQLNGTFRSLSDTSSADLGYVFATPFLGGQAAVHVSTAHGHSSGTLDATLNAALMGNAGTLSGSRFFSVTSDETTFGDLVPSASLQWKQGDNSFMTYVTGNAPVGVYNARSLTNFRPWLRCD